VPGACPPLRRRAFGILVFSVKWHPVTWPAIRAGPYSVALMHAQKPFAFAAVYILNFALDGLDGAAARALGQAWSLHQSGSQRRYTMWLK